MQTKFKNAWVLTIICFIVAQLNGCSPKMHIIGFGMRQFNLSQNKYSKQNPYIKTNKSNSKRVKKR